MKEKQNQGSEEVPLFWHPNEYADLKHFEDPSACVHLAMKVLERMQTRKRQHISVICGPISTPKHVPIRQKIQRFKDAIKFVAIKTADTVFDQMIFERVFVKFQKKWHEQMGSDSYPMPILEEFYRPVFASGFITQAYFIPGWQESFGASWERKELKKLKIPAYDLMSNWQEELSFLLRTLR